MTVEHSASGDYVWILDNDLLLATISKATGYTWVWITHVLGEIAYRNDELTCVNMQYPTWEEAAEDLIKALS